MHKKITADGSMEACKHNKREPHSLIKHGSLP